MPTKGCTILIAAKAGEVEKSAKIQIPSDGDDRVIIDDRKPARLAESKRGFHRHHRQGVQLHSSLQGSVRHTAAPGFRSSWARARTQSQIRFNDRELTAAAIETAIRGIRAALGDEQAAVQILIKGGVSFGDGFALKEFAEVAGIGLTSGDVDPGCRLINTNDPNRPRAMPKTADRT